MSTSIARDAVSLTAMKISVLFINTLSAVLLSHSRTLAEYGTYSQILMAVTLAVSLFAMGLPNSINYFLASRETLQERVSFLSTYYTSTAIIGLAMGAFLVAILPVMAEYFNNYHLLHFSFAVLILPWTRLINSSLDNVLIVEKKTFQLMTFRIVAGVITLLIIFVATLFDWDFFSIIQCFIVSEVLFAILACCIVGRISQSILIGIDWRLLKSILVFSSPLGLASVIGTLNVEADKLMVGYFYNTETLAIYTNAAREMPVTIVASSITAVLMPELVRMLKVNYIDEACIIWGNATYLSYIFLCFFASALFVFAPQIISILYSDKYLPGVAIFRVYAVALLLRTTYFGMVLNCIGKTKIIIYCSLLSLVLNVLFNFVFHYLFGIIGFAIATFASISIVAYLQLLLTGKSLGKSIANLMPWNRMLHVTIINILLGLFAYMIADGVSMEMYLGASGEAVAIGVIWLGSYSFIMKSEIRKIWTTLHV